MDIVGNIGSNRTRYSSEKLLYTIGDTRCTRFQYRQVSSLVSVLMRRENVFRPKAAYED